MHTLSKTFRFESAHRLAKGYEGKCANIHGHSWNGKIAVECEHLDSFDMGVDYSVLGEFIKELEAALDHKIWLWQGDELCDLMDFHNMAIVKFVGNPTSEALAKHICDSAINWFAQKNIRVTVKYVEVKETCTTACRYEI